MAVAGLSQELIARARAAFAEGETLAAQGRDDEALQAYGAAIAADPAAPEPRYQLGSLLHRMGRLAQAEQCFLDLIAAHPALVPARLALGAVRIDAQRPCAAEAPLREGLAQPAEPRLKAALHTNLGLALRRQRKDAAALEQYDRAQALDPRQAGLAVHRAEALQNLERHEEALAVYRAALKENAADPELHRRYNDLLYRLDRRDGYLRSYDEAPDSRALKLGKAFLLAQEKRADEALEIYAGLLRRDPGDRAAALGASGALAVLGRIGEAEAALAPLLARREDVGLLGRAAEIALIGRDPQKAEAFLTRALAGAPHDQFALAHLGLAWRLMGDAREEALNGYDAHIRVFDLEPPQGFSRMEDFNAELCAWLDRLHPDTREYVNQSLRGGTQTPDHLFAAGHELVDRLERRIAQALDRYIAEMKGRADHPLLARRAAGFRYSGSWSSRLRRCGFHVNHIHPEGWISSCYYVGVPPAAGDAAARQGWIKFGEPAAELGLSWRRAVQPVPGRLVLFPSYMWHGTIPFEDDAARTTIAFDVIPAE
jgi:tetratricopeptide (TPR) repeat protein